jgi:hypothetical protein
MLYNSGESCKERNPLTEIHLSESFFFFSHRPLFYTKLFNKSIREIKGYLYKMGCTILPRSKGKAYIRGSHDFIYNYLFLLLQYSILNLKNVQKGYSYC